MALFGKKKNTDAKKETAASVSVTPVGVSMSGGLAHVLHNPRITEKATMHSAESVYAFDVSERSTKQQIASAVRQLYKVSPRMVRIVTVPTKQKRNARTGKRGVKRGGKKAYVYLKKGETITLA